MNRLSDSHQIWRGASFRHRLGTGWVKNVIFSKSKMAADETGNRLKNVITSERFIRFAPNLVSGIYSSYERGLQSQKPEIHNPRWPPAAILNFTKTLITFEPFVRIWPNLAWRFVFTSPIQWNCQKRISFFKLKIAAVENAIFWLPYLSFHGVFITAVSLFPFAITAMPQDVIDKIRLSVNKYWGWRLDIGLRVIECFEHLGNASHYCLIDITLIALKKAEFWIDCIQRTTWWRNTLS